MTPLEAAYDLFLPGSEHCYSRNVHLCLKAIKMQHPEFLLRPSEFHPPA